MKYQANEYGILYMYTHFINSFLYLLSLKLLLFLLFFILYPPTKVRRVKLNPSFICLLFLIN